jgi:GAF domain-containing protein
MQVPPRTAQVVCESAVDATAATVGWLGIVDGDDVVVVAASADDATLAASMVGHRLVGRTGSVGFVLQSGQPMAVQPAGRSTSGSAGDEPAEVLLGRAPLSLLCVPCSGATDAVGVLQVLDKAGGGAFSFDDVEVVTLLGSVMGAAFLDAGNIVDDVPVPGRLTSELTGLADADPARYATVARIVDSLLHGS